MSFFALKISAPGSIDTVNKIKSGDEDIIIEQLNQLEADLKLGSDVFIQLAGDKVSWDKGLIGLAEINKEPFDKGYDNNNPRNFKLGLQMVFVLDSVIPRKDFRFIYDAYDAAGIGPNTKGEQNQAIKGITNDQAAAIFRGMLEKAPDLEGSIRDIYDESFCNKIFGKSDYLIERNLTFNEYLNLKDREYDEEVVDLRYLTLLENDKYSEECIRLLNKYDAFDSQALSELTDLEWSKSIIQMGHPILLRVPDEIITKEDLSGFIKVGTDRPRYYSKIFNINDERYVFINHWYGPNVSPGHKDSRTPFIDWLKSTLRRQGVIAYESNKVFTGAKNEIYYGVPGSGKSKEIDDKIYGKEYERVVFHPDYTYSDFVGQILPKVKDGHLTYAFEPGPFTKILKKAIYNPEVPFYLVIEEINRGNAPAIFGDIFQMLDRKEDGSGKYTISNSDIAYEIYGDADRNLIMPSNLFIEATMNTSDQNVFTLDTAFQRRWEMNLIKNDVLKSKNSDNVIADTGIKWGDFAYITNKEIVKYNRETGGSEDKRLGAYFVNANELSAERFSEKVLKYLWDDAFRLDPHKFFNDDIDSIDQIVDIFTEKNPKENVLKRMLNYSVYEQMINTKMVDDNTDSTNNEDALDEE